MSWPCRGLGEAIDSTKLSLPQLLPNLPEILQLWAGVLHLTRDTLPKKLSMVPTIRGSGKFLKVEREVGNAGGYSLTVHFDGDRQPAACCRSEHLGHHQEPMHETEKELRKF